MVLQLNDHGAASVSATTMVEPGFNDCIIPASGPPHNKTSKAVDVLLITRVSAIGEQLNYLLSMRYHIKFQVNPIHAL